MINDFTCGEQPRLVRQCAGSCSIENNADSGIKRARRLDQVVQMVTLDYKLLSVVVLVGGEVVIREMHIACLVVDSCIHEVGHICCGSMKAEERHKLHAVELISARQSARACILFGTVPIEEVLNRLLDKVPPFYVGRLVHMLAGFDTFFFILLKNRVGF